MINLNSEQIEYIKDLLDMSLGSLVEIYDEDEDWVNKEELDAERELILSIQHEIDKGPDYANLYPLCEREAHYRIEDMFWDAEGCESAEQYILQHGKDVDKVIEALAKELYKESDRWINDDVIDVILHDTIVKEVLYGNNTN